MGIFITGFKFLTVIITFLSTCYCALNSHLIGSETVFSRTQILLSRDGFPGLTVKSYEGGRRKTLMICLFVVLRSFS